MNCFFFFELCDGKLFFHAEYCTGCAVHSLDGAVCSLEKLLRASGTEDEQSLLRYLNENFAGNNRFFEFLKENEIAFEKIESSYFDTSADI